MTNTFTYDYKKQYFTFQTYELPDRFVDVITEEDKAGGYCPHYMYFSWDHKKPYLPNRANITSCGYMAPRWAKICADALSKCYDDFKLVVVPGRMLR